MIYGMWKPPFLQALPFTAPGFELGAIAANDVYAGNLNFQLSFVSSKLVQICTDISANINQIAERYYNTTEEESAVKALFYPGCDSSTAVADFGREWNILSVNIGATFSNTRNRTTYPTSVAFGPYPYEIYGVMVGQLSAAYKWPSIAIVYDVSGITLFNLRVSQEIRRYMRQNYEHIDVHAFPVDVRGSVEFRPIIQEISLFTRVIFFAMPANVTQEFLMVFADSGEPREEYVHIYLDFVGSVKSPLNLDYNASSDVAASLWKSVFVVAICFDHDDVKMVALRKEFYRTAIDKYNATFRGPNGVANEFITTAYTSILLYAQVLNETINAGYDPRDGSRLAAAMLNRTFTFPAVGSVYIDENGERQNTICLYNFQPELQRFERVRYFDSATRTLRNASDAAVYWGTPHNIPPLSEPVCGFTKDRGPCSKLGSSTLGGIISGIVLVVLVLSCTVPPFLRMQKPAVDENWWVVDMHHLSRAVEVGSSEISGRSHPFSFKSNLLINAPMRYHGMHVWAKVVQISKRAVQLQSSNGIINIRPEFRQLMTEIRALSRRCANINPLIGIGLGPIRLTYLTALCQRGNLGNLIEEVSLDWGLKCSLIADLVEGVAAIHRTTIRRHGHLRPSKCLIDSRLVLKINEAGFYDTLHELQVELINPKNFEAIGETLHNAWVAPELRIELIESATFAHIAMQAEPPADVYAVGGLINYLLQDHTSSKDEKVVDFAFASNHGIPPNAVPLLSTLLYECRNVNPADRPNIWQVKMEIHKVADNAGKLFDQLVKRLEDYAVQLENAVSLRTYTLKQEMEKCDSLLGEMLPRYVLVQLRIGHLVQPQIFHSVTILMTGVAGFEEFVIKSQNSPLELVVFLNNMFTVFDCIIAKYDCYKVETILETCLVVSGLPVENHGDHVNVIASLVLEMRTEFKQGFPDGLHLKAGVHSGPCAAGVVGTARPRYCVFGDSVNVTSRLACTSKANKIHISNATEELLGFDPSFKVSRRGMTYLKGIGSMMTFWLDG
ncbi:receptor-type guanylate cyclase gcy-28-like [Paramacrobiotus metropolitanus]|uniref:receptor-type guanylate cyclase gcy-28-like n=1 Tax=Paramacrobiotus metropolitanus TaxID=2943436 RepID=UPI00244565D5|nr:receptor-type guanylate cyclase gcy-28-like [Paramacrobiotus metropolitanus]